MIKIKIFIRNLIKQYFIKFRTNFIIFKYDGEKINFIKEKSFQSRGEKMEIIIEKIIKSNPSFFMNKKCLVTYDDKPFPKRFYQKYDVAFSTTIDISRPIKILHIPCPYFTG